MNKKITLIIILSLTSCSKHVEFIPEKEVLNEGIVNHIYSERIHIIGGPVMDMNLNGMLKPEDSGLSLKTCEPGSAAEYNCLQIKGTPIKSGIITLDLGGGVYGNMFESAAGFDKTYTIKIIDSQDK